MNDSTDHLLGIGQFAGRVGLSVSAVRFYADRGLLDPAHIDESTGYRFFDPDQVATGCLVRDLRLIGVPLAQVKAALGLPEREVKQLVDVHIAGLESELEDAQRAARDLGSAHRSPSAPARATAVASADLIRAFDQVMPFASSDPELPHLMTVLMEAKGGSIRIVTTDTHRLAVRDLVALETADDFTVLIAVAVSRRLRTQFESSDVVNLRVDGESLLVTVDGVEVRTRIVPAAFPAYEAFLTPPELSTTAVLDRRAFVDILEQFDDSSGAVLLTVGDGQMRVQRRDISLSIEGELHGSTVHVAIDPAYGIEAAMSALGTELVVEIEHDPLRPVIFRSATNGTFVSLLMPYKLD